MLKEQIDKDLVAAMKSKNEIATGALRMIKAAIKNKEIELGKSLDDTETLKVLSSQLKQRRDAAAEYEKGNRSELADHENQEATIIEKYLPAQVSDEDIRQAIDSIIAELDAHSVADLGKVMGKAVGALSGKADGGRINKIAREQLEKAS